MSENNDKYKVWVLAAGETTWATNALEFDTVDEANKWGSGLMWRWLAANDYAVLPVKPELTGYLSTETVERERR